MPLQTSSVQRCQRPSACTRGSLTARCGGGGHTFTRSAALTTPCVPSASLQGKNVNEDTPQDKRDIMVGRGGGGMGRDWDSGEGRVGWSRVGAEAVAGPWQATVVTAGAVAGQGREGRGAVVGVRGGRGLHVTEQGEWVCCAQVPA